MTGPVGGGKSTVARHVADRFRELGRAAAVIDLDLVYCMARQTEGFSEQGVWATARRGAAALADSFFTEDIDVVVVEGEFFSQEEPDALLGSLVTPAASYFVALVVSYEKALERVSGDPTRGMSRDPDFLKRLRAQFTQALPFLRIASLLVEADEAGPRDLAGLILERALAKG